MKMVAQLSDELEGTQQQIIALLESEVDDQNWRPASSEWSYREVAAHLAVTEKECFLDRVIRIAAGENPHFDYSLNTGRDFSQFGLRDWLRQWGDVRREILDFVAGLSDEKLLLTGTHETFGAITVLDVFQAMLDHDREHFQELEQAVAAYQMASCCQTEIDELHQFFQDWFNGKLAQTDENFDRLPGVLSRNFVIISLSGALAEREALLVGLRNAYKTRTHCKIWIENFRFHTLENNIAITSYEEWQQDSNDTITTRISTAIFRDKADTPNGVEWLHVHETWLEK